MSQNRETIRQWGKQLDAGMLDAGMVDAGMGDAGQPDEPLLEVASRLRRLAAKTTTPRPPAKLKAELRQQLLDSYQPGWTARLWRGASSAVAFVALIVVVAAAWWIITNNTQPIPGGQAVSEPPVVESPAAEVSPNAPSHRLGARFGEAIELLGYDLADDTLLPGEEIMLTLYWQTLAQPQVDTSLFVHLYDEEGVLVAQFDGKPPDGTRPTSTWQAGETISPQVALPLPADNLAPGNYQLAIGLYLPESGERLVVTQPEGQSTELTLGSIFVEPLEILQPDGSDHVKVIAVTPESGLVLSGTAPITFEITVNYELTAMSEAVIQAAVVQQRADGGGRGVANTQTMVQQGSGEVVLTAVLYPQRELNGAADLGLLVQMHHPEHSAAVASEMPDDYYWRYEP